MLINIKMRIYNIQQNDACNLFTWQLSSIVSHYSTCSEVSTLALTHTRRYPPAASAWLSLPVAMFSRAFSDRAVSWYLCATHAALVLYLLVGVGCIRKKEKYINVCMYVWLGIDVDQSVVAPMLVIAIAGMIILTIRT